MYSKILVGTDTSPRAGRAVEHAARLAQAFGAELHVVSVYDRSPGLVVAAIEAPVVDDSEWVLEALGEVERNLAAIEADLIAQGVNVTTHVSAGDPVKAILDVAGDTGVDLIVVGNKGMKGGRRILGSVPNSVAHKAHCHVLVVQTV